MRYHISISRQCSTLKRVPDVNVRLSQYILKCKEIFCPVPQKYIRSASKIIFKAQLLYRGTGNFSPLDKSPYLFMNISRIKSSIFIKVSDKTYYFKSPQPYIICFLYLDLSREINALIKPISVAAHEHADLNVWFGYYN